MEFAGQCLLESVCFKAYVVMNSCTENASSVHENPLLGFKLQFHYGRLHKIHFTWIFGNLMRSFYFRISLDDCHEN